ncbi:MAG: hypothetical protein HC898_07085, partial [Phycisphaerales bacterium]|nr:hypothetical protein [Phycisphaerales bacterium]
NEAIELAKEYGSQQSPAFVNGVLDKMAKNLAAKNMIPNTPAIVPSDPWLNDALTPQGDPPPASG